MAWMKDLTKSIAVVFLIQNHLNDLAFLDMSDLAKSESFYMYVKALQCLAMILNQKVACSFILLRAAP